jgi:hypothetical protein
VQMAVPRWVTARALSLFSSALTGGIAIGAILWGQLAGAQGIAVALYASGAFLLLTPLIGFLLPLPDALKGGVEEVGLDNEPEVALDLSLRSGPISIAVDYRVDPASARDFYDAMRPVQRMKLRNGAFNWSIARDIADPELWTERFYCPTWGDYLRLRNRFTQADLDAQARADGYIRAGHRVVVRRRLERPYGSVRWRADTPDPQQDNLGYLAP